MVTDIIHLQNQKLTTYKGNYDTFEKTREEQIKNQLKAVEANERARSHMQVLISAVKVILFGIDNLFCFLLLLILFVLYCIITKAVYPW